MTDASPKQTPDTRPLSQVSDPIDREAQRRTIMLNTQATAEGYDPASVHEIDELVNLGAGDYAAWNAIGEEHTLRTGRVALPLGKIASNSAENPPTQA